MDLDEIVERHHAALRVVAADADMSPTGQYATVSDPEKFVKIGSKYQPTVLRSQLHDELIARVLEGHSPERGHRAVVMAGPPGAGKGFVQESQFGGLPGFLVVDADMFKEALVEHELAVGGLVRMTPPVMQEFAAAGERFAPFEYASLVHEESSFLAKRLQAEQVAKGTNLVLDTVLKNTAAAEQVQRQMVAHGYQFMVVSVQTTEEVSRASIRDRWEGPYRAFLAGKSALGGRPVPSGFARSVFPDGPVSGPESSAEWLRQNSPGCTEYRVYRREEGGPHHLEVHLVRTDAGWRSNVEAKAQRGADFARSQAGPLRGRGVGASQRTGQQQTPKKPRDIGPTL